MSKWGSERMLVTKAKTTELLIYKVDNLTDSMATVKFGMSGYCSKVKKRNPP